jgi:hypothetical protein
LGGSVFLCKLFFFNFCLSPSPHFSFFSQSLSQASTTLSPTTSAARFRHSLLIPESERGFFVYCTFSFSTVMAASSLLKFMIIAPPVEASSAQPSDRFSKDVLFFDHTPPQLFTQTICMVVVLQTLFICQPISNGF